MSFLTQYLSLVIPYLALTVILTTPLKEFFVPLLGLVTFCYLLISLVARKRSVKSPESQNVLITTLILFLVLSVISLTGGTSSLFFFLLYFIAFLIAFTSFPEAVFVYAALTVLFYVFLEGKVADSFSLSLHLISLVLLSPLAFFFGKEYQEQAREKKDLAQIEQDTTAATEIISKDVTELLKEDGASLSDRSIEKLNDILEETQEIRNELRKEV
jgi:hypothetical protein